MKQTAVQSFWNKIALKLSVEQVNEFLPEFEQAKEIEKEMIKQSYTDGKYQSGYYTNSEEYYNETFKNNEK
jgi:hypothetical protein